MHRITERKSYTNSYIQNQIRFLLVQMENPQLPKPLKTDKKIANGFVQQEMRHKKSKS